STILLLLLYSYSFLFFFNPPPTTEIYTLSLHDALPISSTTPITRVSPGKTATSMPTTRPTTSANRLIGWNTLIKPPPNCCRISITSAFLFDTHQPHQQKGNLRERIHAERQRYIDDLHEHEHERKAADEAGDEDDSDAPVA